jgi:ribose transport system permease protein
MGVFLGVIIIGILNNGMLILNVSSYWQMVTSGSVLLIAVGLDNLLLSRKT